MLPVSERLGFIIEPWQIGVNANTEALTEALTEECPGALTYINSKAHSKPAHEPSNGPKFPVCAICAIVL